MIIIILIISSNFSFICNIIFGSWFAIISFIVVALWWFFDRLVARVYTWFLTTFIAVFEIVERSTRMFGKFTIQGSQIARTDYVWVSKYENIWMMVPFVWISVNGLGFLFHTYNYFWLILSVELVVDKLHFDDIVNQTLIDCYCCRIILNK